MVNEEFIQNDVTNVIRTCKLQNFSFASYIMRLQTSILAAAHLIFLEEMADHSNLFFKALWFYASTIEPSNILGTQDIQWIMVSLEYIDFSDAFQPCFYISFLKNKSIPFKLNLKHPQTFIFVFWTHDQ